ncbi:MAG: preprotein translocase subunit SecA, partial [Planctomycetota bacterium]|nr:preprotein translocase subunit SecA [Planctomycetota bacterium]
MKRTIGEYFQKALSKIFGSSNERIVEEQFLLVEAVNRLEPDFETLSDAGLLKKTDEFRDRVSNGETLNDLLPEAFAAVREASRRHLRTGDGRPMRPFDMQIIGGIILHSGKIAEMVTGEGKTLVATMPAYLNALEGKGVHIVTVNDYLAARDREWMAPVFRALGMSTGAIQNDMDSASRQIQYGSDITYGTNNEFGFDYLRDNMKLDVRDQVQRRRHYAIVDEVDSILIDEARTPLIISGQAEKTSEKYYKADNVVRQLQPVKDYEVKEKEHQVLLTEDGMERAENLVAVGSFYTGDNMDWPHHIEQALKAHNLYKKDKEYVVKDGEVIIVDEFTGRLMPGRNWSDGLHQAVEAKERLRIKEENQTLATITFQNFFKLYDKLAGMTGTAMTEAEEFDKIYGLESVSIPTNQPLFRTNLPDVIYRTASEKFNALVEEIARLNTEGKPLLVGTASIERSEHLSKMLDRRGIQHEVLNAKNHQREAQIIAKAGHSGNVTIATNMAGRGTDIVLGPGVPDMGGLYIIGSERHEARRIDNQLRGRCGRQGDPGSSQFFLSLEDDLMRIFAREWVGKALGKLGMTEGQEISHPWVSRAIERAQKKVETHHFEIRKHLLDYDEVMDKQRRTIYGLRQGFLEGKDLKETIHDWIEDRILAARDTFLNPDLPKIEWDHDGLRGWYEKKFWIGLHPTEIADKHPEEIESYLLEKTKKAYETREQEMGEDSMRQLERFILLTVLDKKWKDHLHEMDQMKSSIGLRGYAQVDPKNEYKKEGLIMFQDMIEALQEDVTDRVLKVKIKKDERLRNLWNIGEARHTDYQAQFERHRDQQ